MMRATLLAILIAACAGLRAAGEPSLPDAQMLAQAYKWTNAEGRVIYSDTPPPDGQAESMSVEPAPAPAEVEKARSAVRKTNRELETLTDGHQERKATQKAAIERQRRRAAACEKAKERLAQLQDQPPNRRLVIEPDGSARRVSWEEMQRLLGEARASVDTECAGQ